MAKKKPATRPAVATAAPTAPSREQAAAWLRGVFPPLIHAVESEIGWLARQRPSWRFHSRSLEYLAPLGQRVWAGEEPNVRQFFRYRPALQANAAEHDRALDRLRDVCAVAYDALVADPAFERAVMDADASFRPNGGDRQWQGAFGHEKSVALAGEYVVNGVPPDGVPHGYTTRDFWQHAGATLLSHRDRHRVFRELKTAITRAQAATVELRDRLVAERDAIADSYGLPAAMGFAS